MYTRDPISFFSYIRKKFKYVYRLIVDLKSYNTTIIRIYPISTTIYDIHTIQYTHTYTQIYTYTHIHITHILSIHSALQNSESSQQGSMLTIKLDRVFIHRYSKVSEINGFIMQPIRMCL